MNCHHAQELVSEALDGALPQPQAEEFRNHLGQCPDCRTFYAEFRESLSLLTELPRVEVDESFDRAVWAKLHAETPRRAAWSFDWSALRERFAVAGFPLDFGNAFRWSPLAAAAMLLMVLALTSPKDAPVRTATLEDNGFSSEAPVPSVNSVTNPDVHVVDFHARTFNTQDEFAAEIPDAIELFLEQNGRELRLESGDEDRLRRSDYVFPVRRLGTRSSQVGTPVGVQNPGTMRPVSGTQPAVIAF